jgi:AcrR family transcriptional regulator
VPSSTWANLPTAKQERVIDAALREFGARGFSSGSLNVIAREADVAKGSLFRYFDDKLELFAHVCEVCSSRIRDRFTTILLLRAEEHTQLFPFLRAVLVDWVEYFRSHPLDRAVTFAANFEVEPEARRVVRAVTDRHYLEVLEALVEEADRRGELADGRSRDHLVATLLLLLPHLATAPSAPELDPVLRLADRDGLDLEAAVSGFVDMLEAAYAANPQDPLPSGPTSRVARPTNASPVDTSSSTASDPRNRP